MKTREIKNRALECLSDNWIRSVAVICSVFVLYLVFYLGQIAMYNYYKYIGIVSEYESFFSGNIYLIIMDIVIFALGFIIVSPTVTGSIWWFIHCARGETNSIGNMFICYCETKLYLKTVAMQAILALIGFFSTMPFVFCIYVENKLIDTAYSKGTNNGLLILIFACVGVLTVCCLLFSVIINLRFILTNYIFVLNPDIPIKVMLIKSFRITKKYLKQIIVLMLSFAWWLIPSVFVFPLFFILPYFAMSITIKMNEIINEALGKDEEVSIKSFKHHSLRKNEEF